MFGAMMTGRRFPNQHTLYTGAGGGSNWTATFTGTVYVTAAGAGGNHFGNTSGPYGGGGGGGGAFMGLVPLSVTSGDVISVSVTPQSSFLGAYLLYDILRNASVVGYVQSGRDNQASTDGRGVEGGDVYWAPLSISLSGGGQASFNGGNGQNGSATTSGSAVFLSGGGGGSGGQTAPPAVNGGTGGSSGPLYGTISSISVWGAGGNGFLPGQQRFGAGTNDVTPSNKTSAFVILEW